MTNKEEAENSKGFLKQFDDLKKKHPDAMLLFLFSSLFERKNFIFSKSVI